MLEVKQKLEEEAQNKSKRNEEISKYFASVEEHLNAMKTKLSLVANLSSLADQLKEVQDVSQLVLLPQIISNVNEFNADFAFEDSDEPSDKVHGKDLLDKVSSLKVELKNKEADLNE